MDSQFSCHICSHVSKTIKGYVNHCQLHSSEYKVSFTCPIKQCKRKLNSYPGLKAHIYRDHQCELHSVAQQFVSVHEDEIKCELPLCQQIFHSIPELLKHLRQHILECVEKYSVRNPLFHLT